MKIEYRQAAIEDAEVLANIYNAMASLSAVFLMQSLERENNTMKNR